MKILWCTSGAVFKGKRWVRTPFLLVGSLKGKGFHIP